MAETPSASVTQATLTPFVRSLYSARDSRIRVFLALSDLPKWQPVSPGLARGAFLFDDPSLGHLAKVISDRPLRNQQPSSDIGGGQDPVDLEQTEDLFLQLRQLRSLPHNVEPGLEVLLLSQDRAREEVEPFPIVGWITGCFQLRRAQAPVVSRLVV